MSESQFNYWFTLKNAHLSSSRLVTIFECNQILEWNLQDIWPESSYVNAVNLAKKLLHSTDIEFSCGITGTFFGAPCNTEQ